MKDNVEKSADEVLAAYWEKQRTGLFRGFSVTAFENARLRPAIEAAVLRLAEWSADKADLIERLRTRYARVLHAVDFEAAREEFISMAQDQVAKWMVSEDIDADEAAQAQKTYTLNILLHKPE